MGHENQEEVCLQDAAQQSACTGSAQEQDKIDETARWSACMQNRRRLIAATARPQWRQPTKVNVTGHYREESVEEQTAALRQDGLVAYHLVRVTSRTCRRITMHRAVLCAGRQIPVRIRIASRQQAAVSDRDVTLHGHLLAATV